MSDARFVQICRCVDDAPGARAWVDPACPIHGVQPKTTTTTYPAAAAAPLSGRTSPQHDEQPVEKRPERLYDVVRRIVFECSVVYAEALRQMSVQEAEIVRLLVFDKLWRAAPPFAEQMREVQSKLELLAQFVESEDGVFAFPDGSTIATKPRKS